MWVLSLSIRGQRLAARFLAQEVLTTVQATRRRAVLRVLRARSSVSAAELALTLRYHRRDVHLVLQRLSREGLAVLVAGEWVAT